MVEITNLAEQSSPDEAATVARATIETALQRVTPGQRDAFWNAIGLYYSVRRHPGADEPKAEAVEA